MQSALLETRESLQNVSFPDKSCTERIPNTPNTATAITVVLITGLVDLYVGTYARK
jgi:hypothetical protein